MNVATRAISQLELDRFVAALLAMLDTAPDAEMAEQQLLRIIINLARHAPDGAALQHALGGEPGESQN